MSQELFRAEILPIRHKLFVQANKILHEEQDAEDAVQEVLLKLWHMRDSLPGYDSPAAFATTVTKNHCLDRLKQKQRMEPLNESYDQQASMLPNPHMLLEQRDTGAVIARIIELLPPLQQSIIRMKDVEEYEVDEIAEITGTTVESVRVNLSRARKKVREEYLKWSDIQ